MSFFRDDAKKENTDNEVKQSPILNLKSNKMVKIGDANIGRSANDMFVITDTLAVVFFELLRPGQNLGVVNLKTNEVTYTYIDKAISILPIDTENILVATTDKFINWNIKDNKIEVLISLPSQSASPRPILNWLHDGNLACVRAIDSGLVFDNIELSFWDIDTKKCIYQQDNIGTDVYAGRAMKMVPFPDNNDILIYYNGKSRHHFIRYDANKKTCTPCFTLADQTYLVNCNMITLPNHRFGYIEGGGIRLVDLSGKVYLNLTEEKPTQEISPASLLSLPNNLIAVLYYWSRKYEEQGALIRIFDAESGAQISKDIILDGSTTSNYNLKLNPFNFKLIYASQGGKLFEVDVGLKEYYQHYAEVLGEMKLGDTKGIVLDYLGIKPK